MESFKDLLQKLQDAHEREVEALQGKVKELSNKKGCDTKRMEELFTRNQQMKEQHRVLTENIKTLENRLRAGLCDRCTVTQEVAKQRQQEYEASRIQSLQHISLLAGEMTNLRKENLKLKEDINNLRAALESRSELSANSSSSVDVKPKLSPDLSPSGAVALISPPRSRSNSQPADGDVGVKTEAEHIAEETECRQLKKRSSFEVYKPQATLASPSWKLEHRIPGIAEGSVESPGQHSSIPPPPYPKKPSISPSVDVKPSRPVVHAPIPYHPKPLKRNPVPLTWSLPECPDWLSLAAAGANQPSQTSPSRLHLPRYPNLVAPISPATTRRPGFGSLWQKQIIPQAPKEPTVVFTFRMPNNTENETKPLEKKESPPPKVQKVSGEEHRDSCDGPLDLSDRAKPKPYQPAKDGSPIDLQGERSLQGSPEINVNTQIPVSSPSVAALQSSSTTSSSVKREQEPSNDYNQEVKDQEHIEEAAGKTEQSNGKKVPVLTLSLRPVVRLETLTSALHKQESLSSNGKQKCPSVSPCASSASAQSSSSANEAESSLDEQEDKSRSGQESKQDCQRKRPRVETETDRESDPIKIHQERRIKITVRSEERSPS